MEKVDFSDLGIKSFDRCRNGIMLSKISDDLFLKCYDENYLLDLREQYVDLEGKILNVDYGKIDSNIVVPKSVVYKYGSFFGYIMPFIYGKPIYDVFDKLSFSQLCELYLKLEKIVKKSNNIVFPDMLSNGNIIVDDNFDVKILDFDGIQIDDYITVDFSYYLGCDELYNNLKYMDDRKYTKNLDIKSLFILFFDAFFANQFFRIDEGILTGKYNIDYPAFCFKSIGLDDLSFLDNISCFFNNGVDNKYIGDIIEKIKYSYFFEYNEHNEKVLVKK